jgi:HEAT repeat protein
VDRAAIEKTLDAILAGGRAGVVAVVDMVLPPGKGDDTRARYALHALAVRVCGHRDRERQRQTFAEALASTLDGRRPKEVQEFVIRQLQVAGRKESVTALGRLLTDEDLADPAAQALLAINEGVAEQFRAALPRARGRARLVTVHALGTLRDLGAAAELRRVAREKDRDLRLTALWALANAGDPDSAQLLLEATAAEGQERVRAASACQLLAERLAAAGRKAEATKIYEHLRDKFTGERERHVREAARRALGGN